MIDHGDVDVQHTAMTCGGGDCGAAASPLDYLPAIFAYYLRQMIFPAFLLL